MDKETIVQMTGLPFHAVARHLFPTHAHPHKALTYSLKKGLTDAQLDSLAALSGRTKEQLSSDPTTWKAAFEKDKVVYRKSRYRVDYYPPLGQAELFRDSLPVGEKLVMPGITTLSQFIATIDSLTASIEASKTNKV